MKTRIKKLFVLLLSVVMVFVTAISVFAANDSETATITTANLNITKSENAPNATFKAYRVMSAKQIGDNLFAYTVEDGFKEFFKDGKNGYTLNADNEILKDGTVITGDGRWTNTNSTVAAALAAKLEAYAKESKIATIDVPADNLPIGYYVVSETATSDKAQVSSKPVLVNLVGDVNITPKDSKTSLEKNILEDGKEVKENTATIGDVINYEVKTSIPTYEANVDKSKLVFKLSDTFTHLVYQKDLAIYYVNEDDQEIAIPSDKYNITTSTDTSFVVELTPEAILEYQGKNIVLKYTAKLGKDAVIGKEGNPNEITLEYTNNPNQEKYTDTLKDDVKTFTYGFKVHKVDKNDETKDMAGAVFAILDEKGNELGRFTYGQNGTIENVSGQVVIEAGNQNYAAIKGLKEGKYKVKEITPPSGYSILKNPVVVEIKALKDENGKYNGKSQLTLAEGSDSNDATVEVSNSTDGNSVDLVVKIFNIKGISLPETGSKTAMYCLLGGAVLVVLGGLYFGFEKLSVRKRQ